jgi:hypothetical protein
MSFSNDPIATAASSKTYRTVVNELAEVAGVPATHTSSPRNDFEGIKDILDKRTRDTQELMKMWAESMIKAGLHPRFPRLE